MKEDAIYWPLMLLSTSQAHVGRNEIALTVAKHFARMQ